MSEALAALKAELERFGEQNDGALAERSRRMLNITRDTGEFLSVLVRATAARRILEIGTSNGYSTLWLAEEHAAFDLVFVDSERSQYPRWWPRLDALLRPGGLLVADNAVSHAAEMAPFVALVEADARYTSCLVPVGNGEYLAVKAR